MPTNALDPRRPSHLLERLLDTPNLPQVVRQLDPQILHQLVRVVGLEDCGEIVSLATPGQLTRVFDVDLWRSDRPGHTERFDADRFGVWLEVLVEAGVSNAALKVAGLDVDFVASAILEHVAVVDQAAETAAAVFRQIVNDSHEEEVYERPSILERSRESGATCEIGGYAIVAKRSHSWDALVAVLGALHDEHQDFFQRLMNSCSSVSAREVEDESGSYQLLSEPEQLRFDVALDREQRRDGQGYVTAAQASAFLQSARRIGLRADAAPARDDLTRAYFRELERQPRWSERESSAPTRDVESSGTSDSGMASFMEMLREAGVVAETPRALLVEGNVAASERRSTLADYMQFVSEHDDDVFARRNEELGYLANVLVSGCSFNSGQFTPADARDAVVATCTLGLENWPRQWLAVNTSDARQSADDNVQLSQDFLLRHDLVTAFRVGWTVLYEQVVVHVARRLMETLSELSSDDGDLHDDLREVCRRLHRSLAAGTPWQARDHLDVIAILDTPSWATLLRLLDEYPVFPRDLEPRGPGPLLRVSTDFSFISENRQITAIRTFIEQLPDKLVG